MAYLLNNENKPYLKFFEDICSIPHISFHEKEISDYLIEFAQARNLWWYRDEIWNVIIKKPASPGYEDHPAVMLQCHSDMVGERTPDSGFNFETDPLKLYVEDGMLLAKDTTLGADCGHGLAYILSILDDTTLKHPSLEAFFSVQEEAGMGGAKNVDYSQFSSKLLINTDMMKEGETYISTANVVGGSFKKQIVTVKNHFKTFQIVVGGLNGGHSALNIVRDQANAIKVATRVIFNIMKKVKINIANIQGGTIKNNIPEECAITFSCDEHFFEEIKNIVTTILKFERIEHEASDPNLFIFVEEVPVASIVADDLSSMEIIEFLQVLSTGALMRRTEDPSIAVGSTNIGTVMIENDNLQIGYMFRSAHKSLIADYMDRMLTLAIRFGAVFVEEYRYSGHNSMPDTYLNNLFKEVYKDLSGEDLTYCYNHGGTDAGTIADNIEGMDVMAIGPNTYSIHKPGEALDLESFDRTYKYLVEILTRL
jgi:dipeptidase D